MAPTAPADAVLIAWRREILPFVIMTDALKFLSAVNPNLQNAILI
jgi:hypothetical protein